MGKLAINILKHLAIHGMTTASRVLRVMWTYETAVFTIATVCLFAKPTLDERPTFTPICLPSRPPTPRMMSPAVSNYNTPLQHTQPSQSTYANSNPPQILPRSDSLDRLQTAATNAYTTSGIPSRYWKPQIVCQTPNETSLLARPSPTPTQIADPRVNDVMMTSHHRRQRSIGSVNLPSESIQSTIAARWARINQISH